MKKKKVLKLEPLGLPIKVNFTYTDKVNYSRSIIQRGLVQMKNDKLFFYNVSSSELRQIAIGEKF